MAQTVRDGQRLARPSRSLARTGGLLAVIAYQEKFGWAPGAA